MTCIICRLPFEPPARRETEEHVFSESIGGTLTIPGVCKVCNDLFGATIDTTLSDHLPILAKREQLNIHGKRGRVPNLFERLLGDAHLAGDPTQKVKTAINPDTGKYETRLIPKINRHSSKNGTAIQVVLDARDLDKAPEIITKVISRAGGEMTPDKLAEIMQTYTIQEMKHPAIKASPKIPFTDYRMGLTKIAYELAWRWLGDAWLEDEVAGRMRHILLSGVRLEELDVKGWMGPATDLSVLKYIRPSSSTHIAFSTIVENSLVITIKVFDCLAAFVVVSESASLYESVPTLRTGFFIELDAITRTTNEWTSQIGTVKRAHWELINSDEGAREMRRRIDSAYP